LAAPLFGSAMMLHLYKRLAAGAKGWHLSRT
jgi:hypothetical protein